MQCYRGCMHPRIETSSTKYTTDKTRTPNAKYNYEPEDLGCFKFLYHLCTTTVAPKTLESSSTSPNERERLPLQGTGKSEDPKYHDIDDMNVYENLCNDKHVPLPPSRERLLPSTNENRPLCMLQRYNH